MKKLLALILAVSVLLGAAALAEGKLTVTSQNVIITDDDSGIFVAKVENTGDEEVYFDYGELVIYSAEGETLVEEDYVFSSPSMVLLRPGEYTYCYDYLWEDGLKDAALGEIQFTVNTDDYGFSYGQLPSAVVWETEGSEPYTYTYAYLTFTNTTDQVLYDALFVLAVTDEAGNVIFVDINSTGSMGVHPGSTVTMRMYIDDDYVKYFEENGVNLDNTEAFVYYEK